LIVDGRFEGLPGNMPENILFENNKEYEYNQSIMETFGATITNLLFLSAKRFVV
jgi:hypothetical protein